MSSNHLIFLINQISWDVLIADINQLFFFFNQVNETRVALQDMDPEVVGSDYINANYVKVSLKITQKTTKSPQQ